MQKIQHFLKRTISLWIVLYYILMTVIMTMPLIYNLFDSIVGRIGDNINFIWRIAWIAKAVFQLHTNPYEVWFLNFPEGWNMAYTEISPAQVVLALPFHFIAGPTFAYNVAFLLTFVLSALGMHLWVYRLTRSHAAALAAGTAFAFLPYRMAHFLVGHFDLTGTQWLPLYFCGFLSLLTQENPPEDTRRFPVAWKDVILAGIGLGLTGLTSQYYLYMTLLISAFIGGIHLLGRKISFAEGSKFAQKALTRLRSFWDTRLWLNLAVMGLIALPMLIAAISPFLSLDKQGGLPDRNLGVVRQYSASITDFLLPSTDHFLLGQWVGSHFNRDLWNESTLYVGVVCLALGILAWIKRKEGDHRHLLWLLVWGGAFALIMAMGTDLHWNEQPVELTLPVFLQNLLNRTTIPIVLPGYIFFRFFPYFAKLRALMRFGLFVNIFVCVGAGLGTAWLVKRFKGMKYQELIPIAIVLLIFLDFYPGPYSEVTKIQARPVDSWLAEQSTSGAVVQMPFVKSEDQEQTYYTLFHNKPFVGGFFNAFPPSQYTRIKPVLEKFPDVYSIELLTNLGVRYILIDVDDYPDPAAIRSQIEDMGVPFVTQIDDQMVFEIEPPQGRIPCGCDE